MKYLVFIFILFGGGFYFSPFKAEKAVKTAKSVERPEFASDQELFDYYANIDALAGKDTSVKDLFPTIPEIEYEGIFYRNQSYLVDGFDYPVGKPDGDKYYKAQRFLDNNHLGEDWNGVGGGNTDLGDPVYSVGNGLVTFSRDVCCGWGKVIRVAHRLIGHPEYKYVETVFAHMHSVNVKTGDLIKRGQQIGTIGTANGRYRAHLHLELRNFMNMSLGPGYSEDSFGYLDPSDFIAVNRPK